MTSRSTHKRAGYTLIEMIIYVAVLSLLASVLFASIIMVIQSFARVRAVRDLAESGRGALERVTYEIRRASAINDAGSVFNNPAGQLQLATTNDAGEATTITFGLSAGNLTLQEGVSAPVNLLSGHISVSSFTLAKWATSTAGAVKVELALSDDRLAGATPVMFRTTAVSRGSY